MTKRPLILVTNDGGITAPGIRALIEVMKELGDVVVVAPDSPQSGMGHAITLNSMLHLERVYVDNGEQMEYSCSGTPADCVKLAVKQILGRRPNLCVSGINHGSNSSINVIYSGTMSAALEAGIPDQVVLNVNIPNLPEKDIKGIKVCRQARANWEEEFDKRKSPQGKDYYWLTGKFVNLDGGEDTDEWALENGYVSVVPVQFDLTAHHVISNLNTWDFNGTDKK